MTAAGAAVPAGPDRQPGRDRRPDHPGLPRAGDRIGRRLQRRGPRRRSCPRRRPGRPHRPGPGGRELPARRRDHRGGAGDRAPRRSIPGYGFLAERADICRGRRSGRAHLRRADSRTIAARRRQARGPPARRRSVGVPVVPGTLEPTAVVRPDGVGGDRRRRGAIGYPLLVKAAAGGGGRGMRRVAAADDLAAALVGRVGRGAGRVR